MKLLQFKFSAGLQFKAIFKDEFFIFQAVSPREFQLVATWYYFATHVLEKKNYDIITSVHS